MAAVVVVGRASGSPCTAAPERGRADCSWRSAPGCRTVVLPAVGVVHMRAHVDAGRSCDHIGSRVEFGHGDGDPLLQLQIRRGLSGLYIEPHVDLNFSSINPRAPPRALRREKMACALAHSQNAAHGHPHTRLIHDVAPCARHVLAECVLW